MNRFIGSSPVVTSNNHYTIADIRNLQSLHTNLLTLFLLVFIYNTITVNKTSKHTNSSSDLRRLTSPIQSPVWSESYLQAVVI
jgi:hypothetical protein